MIKIPEEYLSPINIGGLRGRLLTLPARKEADEHKTILLLPGIHSSQERMYSNAQFYSRYGRVLVPDLPGFGGMDSFFTIGADPDIDTFADYIYTFIRIHKLDKKQIRIVAMSFGFMIATRLLQKHPELVENVEFVVSFVGFGRTSDFEYKPMKNGIVKAAIKFGSTRNGSVIVRTLVFNKLSLRLMFASFRLFNPKYMIDDRDKRRASTEMELDLWTKNDTRTRFYTWGILTDFDLTKGQKPIDLDEHNLTTKKDQYVNAERVRKTMRKLYKRNHDHLLSTSLHAPSVIGTEDDVAKSIPSSLKKVLSK